MTHAIKDGTGQGYLAEVSSDNKLRVRSITETAIEHATELGNAYNINTGEITISADSAILYFKNNEEEDFFVDAVALGITDGTQSDIQKVTVIKNPTAGTIISGATDVDMNVNRNFGSSKTLSDSLAYKGASGNTFTDGDDTALFYQSDNGRLFATVGFLLPKGSSVGIELDVNLSSGSVTVYGAIIGHQVEVV
jgi:hypothetical protein